MRTLFLISVLLVTIASCKKSSDSTTTSTTLIDRNERKFRYTANGVNYNFDSEKVSGSWVYHSWLEFHSMIGFGDPIITRKVHGGDSTNYIRLTVCSYCNTLSTGTYPINGYRGIDCKFNNVWYYTTTTANQTSSSYTLNITSVTDGYASGTFSGTFYPFNAGTGPVVNVTNGYFENLRIL